MLKENPVVKKMVAMGEEQAGKIAQQLLSNETFVGAIQTLVGNSLRAKGLLDKNIRMALSAMNLPSTADVDGLKSRLEDLEDMISRMDQTVTRIAEQQKPPEKAEKRSKKNPETSA